MAFTPQDIQKKMAEDLVRDLTNKGNEIFDSLVTDGLSSIKTIPEEVFVKGFLPYFSGQLPADENNKAFGMWVGIAGSPMARVRVTDASGRPLFEVPPILDTDALNVLQRRQGNSLTDIHSQFEMHRSQIPSAGNRFITEALSKKAQEINNHPANFNTVSNEWMSIFSRYGINSPNGEPPTGVDTKDQPAQSSDLVYD